MDNKLPAIGGKTSIYHSLKASKHLVTIDSEARPVYLSPAPRAPKKGKEQVRYKSVQPLAAAQRIQNLKGGPDRLGQLVEMMGRQDQQAMRLNAIQSKRNITNESTHNLSLINEQLEMANLDDTPQPLRPLNLKRQMALPKVDSVQHLLSGHTVEVSTRQSIRDESAAFNHISRGAPQTTKHADRHQIGMKKYSNFRLPKLGQSPSESLTLSVSGAPNKVQKSSLNLSIQLQDEQEFLESQMPIDLHQHFKVAKKKFGVADTTNKISLKQGISPYHKASDNAGLKHSQISIAEATTESMKKIKSIKSVLDPLALQQIPGSQKVTDNVNTILNKNVSYKMLGNDKERSVQLMKLFDKKLQKLGQIQQSPQKMETIQYELSGSIGKPGVPIPLQSNIKRQKEINLEKANFEIAQQFAQIQDSSQTVREETRNRLNNLLKHKRAISIIRDVENQIRSQRANVKVNLTIDENSGDPRYRNKKDAKREDKKFQEEYDYESYVNAENDSDLAEEEVFKALESHEKTSVQKTSSKINKIPQIMSQKQKIDPYKNTKVEGRLSSPFQNKKEEYHQNPDGTFSYSKDQQSIVDDRQFQVKKRLDQKKDFRKDIKTIVEEEGFAKELAKFDVETGKVNRVPIVEGLNLSRKQSDLMFKEEFESKISKMSNRIQKELDETDAKISLPQELFSPGARPKRSTTDMSSPKKEQHPVVIPETIDEDFEDAPHEQEQKPSPNQKSKFNAQIMISEAKRNRMIKSQLRAEKRRLGQPSELTMSEMEEKETLEERKKRERAELFNRLKDMEPNARRKILRQQAEIHANMDDDQILREELLHEFMSNINKNLDYPINTIQKLVLMKLKEFELKSQNNYTDSKMAKMFAQDELVNGLCLLQCLKSEEITLNEEEMAMSANAVLKAAQLIKKFQTAGDHDDNEIDFDEILRKKEGNSELKHLNSQEYEDQYLTESELKIRNRNKKKQQLFSTDIFKKVFNQIVGHQNIQANTRPHSIMDDSKDPDYKRLVDKLFNIKIIEKPVENSSINKSDESIQKFAQKINLHSELYNVYKFAQSPKVQQDIGKNPALQYFMHCAKGGSIPTTLLNKIHNKVLPLQGYKLSEGQCIGLAGAFKGNPKLINSIIFDNNGLRDIDFSKVLQGMASLDHVKSIIYKLNEFQRGSLSFIKPLLSRRKPMNLEEIRLVSCKIGGSITHELIDDLMNRSTVSKLSLVKSNMSISSFYSLCEYVRSSRTLREIDISNNDLPASQMIHFVENVLAIDRKLVSCNISNNRLQNPVKTVIPSIINNGNRPSLMNVSQISSMDVGKKLSTIGFEKKMSTVEVEQKMLTPNVELKIQTPMPEKKFSTVELQLPEDGSKEDVEEAQEVQQMAADTNIIEEQDEENEEETEETYVDDLTYQSDLIADSLSSFMKYNQNLFHLNLNRTGINEDVVKKICTSLTKARGLQYFHCSGNPGITDKNIQYLQKRVRCKQNTEIIKIDFTPIEHEPENLGPRQIFEKNQMLSEQQKQELMEQNIKLKHIKNSLALSGGHEKFTNEERILEFTRHLGHKFEMPGQAQWILQTNPENHCWVCGQYIFSLIFWSPSIGTKSVKISSQSKMNVIQQIKDHYPLILPINTEKPKNIYDQRDLNLMKMYEEDNQRPIISGEFTNWEPKRMLRIDEYAFAVDPDSGKQGLDLFDLMRAKGNISPQLHKDVRLLSASELEHFLHFKEETMTLYNKIWSEILADYIVYKKPFIGNGQYLAEVQHPLKEQLYVYPCFMRPGKHDYVVIQQDGLGNQIEESLDLPVDDSNYYFYKCIADNRTEEIVRWSKPLKNVKKERLFYHEHSVFKNWKLDKPTTTDDCLEHDFRYWKGTRFCKDPDELKKVEDIIRKHFIQIKAAFHYLMSSSSYPAIGWQDYTNYALLLKTTDDKCNLATIDRAFVAANVTLDKSEGTGNPENALCRYEFIEVIVRLAKAKYIEGGHTKLFSEATRMYITKNLLKNDPNLNAWQGFRDELMYNNEVNDLMEPNIPGLKKLYEKHFQPRKKCMDLHDCYDLFMRATEILPAEKDIMYCFGMSKMTVVNETKDDNNYNMLQFSEFLEMIARVAHFKFSSPGQEEFKNLSLASKIEYILDEILQTINLKRKDPEIVQVDESESDDDY